MKIKKLNEGGLARLWQHTQDDSTFAIIGSQDQDTRKSRFDELKSLVMGYGAKNKRISWRHIIGSYVYNGSSAPQEEDSLLIVGITKDAALEIANKLNQESIVWKDPHFFGILYADGSEMMRFTDDPRNMDFTNVKEFASMFARGKGKRRQFNFKEGYTKLEWVIPDNPGHGTVYYMNLKNAATHRELIWESKEN